MVCNPALIIYTNCEVRWWKKPANLETFILTRVRISRSYKAFCDSRARKRKNGRTRKKRTPTILVVEFVGILINTSL